MAVRIGELLLKEKRITPEQLQQALNQQKANGGKLGYNLVKMGFVKDEEITALLSKQYGVPSINLAQFEIDPAVIKLIPAETAQKYQIIPLSRVRRDADDRDDGSDQRLRDGRHQVHDRLQRRAGRRVGDRGHRGDSEVLPDGKAAAERAARPRQPAPRRPAPARSRWPASGLEELQAIARATPTTSRSSRSSQEISAEALAKQGEEAPVVRLVNVVLMSAIQKGASDIHIEPYEKELRVRYRIDGILYNIMAPPMKFRDAITSRIKIMAKLDIAEKRLPQDGRIKIRFNDNGEPQGDRLPRLGAADALRREDRHASPRQGQADARHDEARLRARVARQVRDARSSGRGAWCSSPARPAAARPTRSTRRSRKINTPETNIMTAEDPVEFNLAGVNQVQVRENIGLNFAAALRSFLRQDPNIILVGEIRDFETAEIAVKAALTGHLVLSTLHTNDAPSTINRLMNMGIEPFLVASSVHLICAQRLVRRVCSQLQGAAAACRRRR